MAAESNSDPARALARLSLAFEDVAADIRRGAEAGGLTLSEIRLLDGISQGVTGARLLSRRLRLDEGHVSRMVKRLKQAGLITARRQTGDSRRVTLGLSKSGASRLTQAIDGAATAAKAYLADSGAGAGPSVIIALQALRQEAGTEDVVLTPMAPGDAGWVILRHAALYAEHEGFDASFEADVTRIVCNFLQHHDARRERCWIARAGGTPVGCVFCVAAEGSDSTAQLRLFLVEPAWRGRGLGRQLIAAVCDFAAEVGYTSLVLFTHREHKSACRLYDAIGFRVTESRAVTSYGRALTEQIWSLPLDAPLAKPTRHG